VRSSTSTTERIIAVGVPIPGLGLLSYRVPAELPLPAKGARVSVPVGGRTVVGCVVESASEAPPATRLRDVREVLDADAFLPGHVVDLALWVGDYYASGPGDALAMAMPPSARTGRKTSFRTARVAEAVPANELTAVDPPGRERQRAALDRLRASSVGISVKDFRSAGVTTAVVDALVKTGFARWRTDVVERDPFDPAVTGVHWTMAPAQSDDRALTVDQAAAFEKLSGAADRATFQTVLLQGVTGSGKTELYLRLAAAVLGAGRRVLILVPEIALTPAVAGQFRARFGARVAIQHSGLSSGERHDQWHRIRRGDVDIVVGTRSAVFAPIERVGLIVVDEEHDNSYKQDESPRYHGRDVAVVRGRMEHALVVLGTATPSLESAANARAGRYQLLTLAKRVLDRPMADVRIVDMRQEFAAKGPDVVFSQPLLDAMRVRLDRGEQAMVLLNRRGFASAVFCRGCGSSIDCPHCSVTLTFHRAAKKLRCHYCNYATAVPSRCAICAGEILEQSGFGTERLESELSALFPSARIERVDRDTIQRRGAMAAVLSRMARGDIDILIGTQMIAKGHDFPSVTLVGVVSADVGLGLADFRASERTFQLITQVVGRAGRGDSRGEAVVQSIYPDHYSIRAAAAQDYRTFFEREIEYRTRLHYPPATSLINVVVKGKTLDRAMADATTLASSIRRSRAGVAIVGPAPAPLSKVKDEYRA